MNEVLEIDFSNITEINCNSVDLTALYVQEGNQAAKLVWSKPGERTLTFYFYDLSAGITSYSVEVVDGTTWGELAQIDKYFAADVDTITTVLFFSPYEKEAVQSWWVVDPDKVGSKGRVFSNEIIEAKQYELVLRTRASSDGTTEFVIYLGTQEVSATGEGVRCVFVTPEAGNYIFYSDSNNAALGYEHDNEVEYNDNNRIELSLEDKQEVCIICATNNWEEDTYSLVVEKT